MIKMKSIIQAAVIGAICALSLTSYAEDWPTWGGDHHRNMVSNEKGIVTDFNPGKFADADSNEIDMKTTRNVRWVATLGSQSFATPVIADGKVYVGTNNQATHHQRFKGDRSIMLCLDEKTGKFLWQLTVPKIAGGTKVGDWEYLGICAAPTIEGNRAYMVTNRCEIICVDTEGLANGNDGPFKDEGQYMANGLDSKDPKPPVEVTVKDADIIWRYDMRDADNLGVFPHNVTSSSILIVGEKIYVSTSNGVDWQHVETPSPRAPSLVALDKKTGKLLGEDDTQMSTRILHGNWTSPTHGKVDDKDVVIFGGPDGWIYTFDTTVRQEGGYGLLDERWRFDANPKYFRVDPKTGRKRAYNQSRISPSEIIATPVFYKNRIYVQIGQDPEHGEHLGNFVCVDVKTGKQVWNFDKMNTGMQTAAVVDDRVYISDFSGFMYCLDANDGKLYWRHDTLARTWASPLVVSGKLIQGNDDGILTIVDIKAMADLAIKEGKGKPLYTSAKSQGRIGISDPETQKVVKILPKVDAQKIMHEIEMHESIRSSPVVANGVLYLMTNRNLYAVAPE